MRTRILLGIGLILLGTTAVRSQEVTWRPAKAVTLGVPASSTPDAPPRLVRAQVGDPPPPPPPVFPGAGAPGIAPGNSVDIYNKGMPNNDADLGGFWSRTGDHLRRCWDDITGGVGTAFQGGKRQPFQCDHDFDIFVSPVTNPFFFEDPRSLTEIRPIFIWQHTPGNNPVWAGGNNFDFAVRGSVAITENISVVVSRLGFTSINPRGAVVGSATGFSDLLIGPKLTFIRNETSNTVAAVGLTFDIPTGSSSALQHTGNTSLVPYFSIAQNFGRTDWGSFNFMNTTGYSFRTDNVRSESFYSSFHLDFDWKGAHRVYPLVELNWRHYTRNGNARPFFFEGNDLANFGSAFVSGHDDLNLAIGTRVVFNKTVTWGIAAEFNVLNNSDGRHLDQFRLTTDLIFRY